MQQIRNLYQQQKDRIQRIANFSRSDLLQKLKTIVPGKSQKGTNQELRNKLIDETNRITSQLVSREQEKTKQLAEKSYANYFESLRDVQLPPYVEEIIRPLPDIDQEYIELDGEDQNLDIQQLTQRVPFPTRRHPRGSRYAFIVETNNIFDNTIKREIIVPEAKSSFKTYTPANAVHFYYMSLQRYHQISKLYIRLYSINEDPQSFTLYTSKTINCVLKELARVYTDSKTLKKIKKYDADSLRDVRKNPLPVTKEHLDILQKQFRTRFIIHSKVDIWYDTDPTNKKKFRELHLYASEDHATTYIPVTPIRQQIIAQLGDLQKCIPKVHQPIKLNLKISPQMTSVGAVDYTLQSFRIGDTIVKSYVPPAPDSTSSLYFGCTDESQYLFKRWEFENNMRPLTSPYYEITKQGVHPFTTQKFQDFDPNRPLHLYDQNKAFPSATTDHNPNFKKYGIKYGCVKMFSNTNIMYTQRPGMSFVTSVNDLHPILQKTLRIQPQNWYYHQTLGTYIDEGLLSATISHTILFLGDDIPCPWSKDLTQKQMNNNLIGKLIAGGLKATCTEYYHVSADHPIERKQLEYQLSQTHTSVYTDQSSIIMADRPSKSSQLWQMYGQIIAYQEAAMITQMAALSPETQSKIVMFNVDGFFTSSPISADELQTSIDPFKFKYEYKPPRHSSTKSPAIHEPQQPPQYAPPIEVYAKVLGQLTATNGPAGAGKSYISLYQYPIPGTSVHLPTYAQVVETKDKIKNESKKYLDTPIKLPVYTTQSLESDRLQITSESWRLDECNQTSQTQLDKIQAAAIKNHVNLDLVGDFEIDPITSRVVIYQRPPPSPAGKPISKLRGRYLFETIIMPVRRQNQQDCDILDSLRGMSSTDQLRTLRNQPHITSTNKYDIKSIVEHAVFISTNHNYISTMNKYAREYIQTLKIHEVYKNHARKHTDDDLRDIKYRVRRVGRSTSEYIRGGIYNIADPTNSLIYWDRTNAKQEHDFDFEPAYARTSDSLEGSTIDQKIIIDCRKYDLPGYIYTAATRCKKLSDVTLFFDGGYKNIEEMSYDLVPHL